MSEEKPSRRPTLTAAAIVPGDETVRPPYDPEEFARESDSRLRVADVALKPPRTPLPIDEPPPSSASAARLAVAAGIPSPEAVPFRLMENADLEWFDLDPETMSLLDRVNGVRTIARIAESVGVATPLACAVFMRLAKEQIVDFR